MKDDAMTKKQLIDELAALRQRFADLEVTLVRHRTPADKSQFNQKDNQLLSEDASSLEKYRIIADFSYDWEYWMGPDRQLVHISPSSERITGYTASEFISNPGLIGQIVHPEDRGIIQSHIAECDRDSPDSCRDLEYRIITKNGDTVWLAHRCQPVYLRDGSYGGRRASNTDITSRRRAEDELKKGEEQLRAIMEAVAETIFLMDKDGMLLIANQTTASRLGTDLEGLKQGSMFDRLPPDIAKARKERVKQVVETRKPVEFEDERFGRTIMNSIYPVIEKDCDVRYLAVFGRDITDERRTGKLLEESEERYRSFFHNNHATLLIIDPQNGKIMDANPAACEYYGYDSDTLKTMYITDINTLAPEQVFEEMARAKAEQRKQFYFYHRLANGEVRPVEVYSGPVMVSGKSFLYSIVHDISERKKAEAEKERLIFELRDALSKIKTLSGMLPICASCKKIRDDKGYWKQIESYIREHSEAEFSHSICPECVKKLYPDFVSKDL